MRYQVMGTYRIPLGCLGAAIAALSACGFGSTPVATAVETGASAVVSQISASSTESTQPGANGLQQISSSSSSSQQLFSGLDSNGDGVITEQEAPRRLSGRFSLIDRNGDGTITLQELDDYVGLRLQPTQPVMPDLSSQTPLPIRPGQQFN